MPSLAENDSRSSHTHIVGLEQALDIRGGLVVSVLSHAYILEDPHHSLSLSDIATKELYQRFLPFSRPINPRSAYWVRFRITNLDSVTLRRYFYVGAGLVDTGIVYRRILSNNLSMPDSINHTGQWNSTQWNSAQWNSAQWDSSFGGASIAFAKRNMKLKGVWHQMDILPQTEEEILVRISALNGLALGLEFYTEEGFRNFRDSVLTFYAFILGMTFFAMMYNFIIALTTGDKPYKYYTFNAGVWFLGGLFTFFPVIEELFPYVEFLSTKLQLLVLVLGGFSTSLFALHFLEIRRFAPVLFKILCANIAVQVFSLIIIWTPLHIYVSTILNLTFAPGSILLVVAAVRALQQGYTPARWYLLGWVLYLASIIMTILSFVGVIPYSEFLTVRMVWLGVGLETLVFSFALAERMNTVRKNLVLEHEQRVLLEKEREREQARSEEIARFNQELQQQNEIVSRQSVSLQQANTLLVEQNTRLEELNREKNEIVAMVSHDLKNPLAALRGIIELLQSANLNPSLGKSALLQMQTTVDKMLAMVKNLLDVNRLEAGVAPYHLVAMQVAPVLRASVEQFRKIAESKGTLLEWEESESPQTRFIADEQALLQVVDNLISNALKYSPYRSIVQISSFEYHAAKADISLLHQYNLQHFEMLLPDCIVIVVRDQGPGISQLDQTKLFGKFVRLSAQPTGGEHSSGLGLSIVQKLVEGMHGRVWCESDFGYGSRFFVALPITQPEAAHSNGTRK